MTLEGFLPEMGIFVALSFLLTLMYLDTVRGKLHRIPGQLASYEWVAISSERMRRCVSKCLMGFIVFFVLTPFITLIAWGCIITYSVNDKNYDFKNDQKPLITPIAIFLVGFAAMSFLIGVLNTRWKKYRLTRCSIVMTALGLLFFVVFQVTAIFLDTTISYFGVSTIFLASNSLFVILVVFINSDTGGRSIKDLVETLPDSKEALVEAGRLEEVKEEEEMPSGHSQHSQHSAELLERPKKKKAIKKKSSKNITLMERVEGQMKGPEIVDQPVRDRYRDTPFDDEINEDEEDPTYVVTKQEVGELFTLADV